MGALPGGAGRPSRCAMPGGDSRCCLHVGDGGLQASIELPT
jgi:hypothetical protein